MPNIYRQTFLRDFRIEQNPLGKFRIATRLRFAPFFWLAFSYRRFYDTRAEAERAIDVWIDEDQWSPAT
jgi:hypothetical protein